MTDNAKELLALDPVGLNAAVRECARITAPEIDDAEFERIKADNSPRYRNTVSDMERVIRACLSARQQASVEEVARIFRNQLLQLDLECGERVNIHDAIAKLRGDADVGAAIVLVAEVATWAADALLAKYDIFEKVEG